MRFLLLLLDDEEEVRSLSAEERRAIVDEHIAFAGRLRETGAYVGGEAVGSPADTKVLRRVGGRPVVTDGPFAETKEQLGGFYLLECDDVDAALSWAEQVPKSPGLVVEIRSIAEV